MSRLSESRNVRCSSYSKDDPPPRICTPDWGVNTHADIIDKKTKKDSESCPGLPLRTKSAANPSWGGLRVKGRGCRRLSTDGEAHEEASSKELPLGTGTHLPDTRSNGKKARYGNSSPATRVLVQRGRSPAPNSGTAKVGGAIDETLLPLITDAEVSLVTAVEGLERRLKEDENCIHLSTVDSRLICALDYGRHSTDNCTHVVSTALTVGEAFDGINYQLSAASTMS